MRKSPDGIHRRDVERCCNLVSCVPLLIGRMYSVIACSVKMYYLWKFPGSLVIETPHFQCRGHGFDPWSGELGSHMLHGMAWQKIETYHLCLPIHDLAPLENLLSTRSGSLSDLFSIITWHPEGVP